MARQEWLPARPLLDGGTEKAAVHVGVALRRQRAPIADAGQTFPVPENRTFKPPPKIDSNALNESRPLFFFAGIWTAWNGVRKVKTGLVPLNCSAS